MNSQNRDCNSHNMFQAEKRKKSSLETWGKGDSQYNLGIWEANLATWNGANERKPAFVIDHLPGDPAGNAR